MNGGWQLAVGRGGLFWLLAVGAIRHWLLALARFHQAIGSGFIIGFWILNIDLWYLFVIWNLMIGNSPTPNSLL